MKLISVLCIKVSKSWLDHRGSGIFTCSSAPLCGWSVPAAAPALKLDPCSAARGGPDLQLTPRRRSWTHSGDSADYENRPGPFSVRSCSSPSLRNLQVSPPGPPCSQRRRSRSEEDSPEFSWCRRWFPLRAASLAAGGRSDETGRAFLDAGFGTSTIQRCHKEDPESEIQWHKEQSRTGLYCEGRDFYHCKTKRDSGCF